MGVRRRQSGTAPVRDRQQAGFTQETFDKCLTDQKLLDDITAGRSRASDVFGVSATPTFYINGKKLDGAPTMEKFDAMIEPLLTKS
ncbi:MAG: DsbA family protein [Hyphomicrobium sp.]|nr:DsbA family protein [Hyphomicrobium sp.]